MASTYQLCTRLLSALYSELWALPFASVVIAAYIFLKSVWRKIMIANFRGRNLFSHLADEIVKDVKMMLLYSGLSETDIARYKGLTPNQVCRIKLGDCYSNIDID